MNVSGECNRRKERCGQECRCEFCSMFSLSSSTALWVRLLFLGVRSRFAKVCFLVPLETKNGTHTENVEAMASGL